MTEHMCVRKQLMVHRPVFQGSFQDQSVPDVCNHFMLHDKSIHSHLGVLVYLVNPKWRKVKIEG